MPRRANRNLHVPLPDDTYQELKSESERVQQPATTLAREAIRFWLEQRRRARLADEIRTYAEAVGGTPLDLDADLEKAAVDHLTRVPARRKAGSRR